MLAEAYRPLPGRFGTAPAADATLAALDRRSGRGGPGCPVGLDARQRLRGQRPHLIATPRQRVTG
ncbi:hypothetical protein ACU4GR_00385 [Methylobacterium oryzae CBMB20]